jgi:hypothetical protein
MQTTDKDADNNAATQAMGNNADDNNAAADVNAAAEMTR